MALLLVQHGKSLPKEVDAERGLSEEGIAECERIASVARGYKVHISSIIHSGKKRAHQTADIFAAALQPEQGVKKDSGLNPLDDVSAYAEKINSHEDLMLVGHLPFMENLAAYLITESTDRPVFKFQNGGIVCLDQDPGLQAWAIKWALMPHVT